MANNVYTMEAVNLVCGDTGSENAPGTSTHLVLTELKLPEMAENYVDFLPGGAPAAIEINTHINRLEAAFNLAGWQPQVMGLLAQADAALQSYTAYGLIRERRTGEACQAIAHMRGRMGRVNPTNFRRGDLQLFEYSIRSITSYRLEMSPGKNMALRIIYDWDFFESKFLVAAPDGTLTDVNADMIQILGLNTTSA